MTEIPSRLIEIAEQVRTGNLPQRETVRTILQWFGIQRRGMWIVDKVHLALRELGLRTEPNFEFAYIDGLVDFLPYIAASSSDTAPDVGVATVAAELPSQAVTNIEPELSVTDPTYRIGKLASANKELITVKLDTKLEEATSLMLVHDFSQLPVMDNEYDVKGVISWRTIGARLAHGKLCKIVRDCIEPHHEISAEVSLFVAIDAIVTHEYLLVRDSKNRISGIVTTSDLSLQFLQLV